VSAAVGLLLLRWADGRPLCDSLVHLLGGEQRPDRPGSTASIIKVRTLVVRPSGLGRRPTSMRPNARGVCAVGPMCMASDLPSPEGEPTARFTRIGTRDSIGKFV